MCLRILKRKLCCIQLPQRFFANDCEDKLIKAAPQHTRDHMKRTEYSIRHREICPATVLSIEDLSPTVKGVSLHLENKHRAQTSFLAGQWVDMMIPGIETVGGFSICNSPRMLQEHGLIELAVKFSDHSPAHWIHTQCEVGDDVDIRIGGNFHYKETENKHMLLIAGGVGINPLFSIFQHKRDLCRENLMDLQTSQTTLLYSAKTYDELIFKEKINDICTSMHWSCHFHVTKEQDHGRWLSNTAQQTITGAKISRESIEAAVASPYYDTDTYICGPPQFIDTVADYLINLGFLRTNIFYEKWW